MKTRALIFILPSVLVVLLTSSCATRLNTSMHLGGDYARIKRLIEKGADVNAQDNDGRTALMTASMYGYTDIVWLLIEEGADVNAKDNDGGTALMSASACGHLEVTKLLIEKRADVNAVTISTYWSRPGVGGRSGKHGMTYGGYTALMAASEYGHTEIVKLLIEEGADVNARDYMGRTAFNFASEEGHTEIVKLLREAGAKE